MRARIYLTDGRLIALADLFAAGPIVFVTISSLTLLNLGVFYLTFACRHSPNR